MPDVILENVTKLYAGGIVGVRDLSLHVRHGELLVLVGPSGCGKSTTLRLIAGLEQPTEGIIRIDGRNMERVPPRDRHVAMVFQDHSLYPHMTVRQNLDFPLKMRRIARRLREEKVRTAAEALGIADLLDRRPGELSGGQRQRAALGRALVLRPSCFLLDEPLSNLDPATRVQLRGQIRILQRQINGTMIHVTHDQEEALTLGDRIAVMNDGSIVQIGSPLEVFHEPVNEFVAGFIGSPRMNFIPGRIESREGRLFFTDGRDLRLPIPDLRRSVLAGFAGERVTAGIRPRQLVDAAAALDHQAPILVRALNVEPLGDQNLLHAQTAEGVPITAVVNAAHDYEIDRHATLCVDPEAVHFFDEAGDRI